MVPTLIDPGATHTCTIREVTVNKLYFLDHRSNIPLGKIDQFQKYTPGYYTIDMVRRKWLHYFS